MTRTRSAWGWKDVDFADSDRNTINSLTTLYSLSSTLCFMLDVHPPHAPTHTWKDFFIHIATICVGLLIAIGLEQSVEAIHHRHERDVLVQEMRLEAERNILLLHTDIDRNLEKAAWNRAILTALQTSHPQNGIVTVTLPTHEASLPQIVPSRAVWSVAKTNGKVALLSEREAEIYDRLDTNSESEARTQQAQALTITALQSQAVRLNLHLDSGATIQLPAADLTPLAQALADTIAAADADSLRCAFYLGASRAVDDRIQDRDDMWPYLQQERIAFESRLAHP